MKIPVEKVPYSALAECALCIAEGDARPGREPGDWLTGFRDSIKDAAAIIRHAYAYIGGEDYDPDTGRHHCGYIMARCCIILERHARKLPDGREPISFATVLAPGPVVAATPVLQPANPEEGAPGAGPDSE